jgi:hypothetical protein
VRFVQQSQRGDNPTSFLIHYFERSGSSDDDNLEGSGRRGAAKGGQGQDPRDVASGE